MPIVDIIIALVVVASIILGFARGFVKEAMSLATLLFALWAALNFGDDIGAISQNWLSAPELQLWFGRILVFVVLVTAGGLVSWLMAKLMRLSVLSGTDRLLGMAFGLGRGVLLVAASVLGGQMADVDDSDWWQRSSLIPYAEYVADWLRVMAPKGVELIQQERDLDLPMELELPNIG